MLKDFQETGAGVGVGLAGMKQRVGQLGGLLRIECDGKGTCVIATVPLAKAETATDEQGQASDRISRVS